MSKKLLVTLNAFFLIVLIGMVGILFSILGDSQQATPKEISEEKQPKSVEPEAVDPDVEQPEKIAAEPDAVESNTDSTWDDIKEKDRIVGKSDKDFKTAVKDKPAKVRNDQTGKWRKTSIAESIDIEDYALSYQKEYMKNDEVHFIVNFTRNTTTWLNATGGLLFVEIREHVKSEEHDAKTLGSGMVLKSYTIYPDGDIEETDF